MRIPQGQEGEDVTRLSYLCYNEGTRWRMRPRTTDASIDVSQKCAATRLFYRRRLTRAVSGHGSLATLQHTCGKTAIIHPDGCCSVYLGVRCRRNCNDRP